ncbi:MAG: hypothetical protein ACP5HM_10880 [Anaerolineae bacterium]
MKQKQEVYRYPWLRNLFLLVVYVALIIFLWNFPGEGVKVFFRNLLGGILYLLAGLVLVGLTLLLLIALLPAVPKSWVPEEEDDEEPVHEMLPEENVIVLTGRTLGVPKLRDPQYVRAVWDILAEVEASIDGECLVVVDDRVGTLSVSAENPRVLDDFVRDLSGRLQKEGLYVRRVRT